MRRVWDREGRFAALSRQSDGKVSIPIVGAENGPTGWKLTSGLIGILASIFRMRKNS